MPINSDPIENLLGCPTEMALGAFSKYPCVGSTPDLLDQTLQKKPWACIFKQFTKGKINVCMWLKIQVVQKSLKSLPFWLMATDIFSQRNILCKHQTYLQVVFFVYWFFVFHLSNEITLKGLFNIFFSFWKQLKKFFFDFPVSICWLIYLILFKDTRVFHYVNIF